VTALCRVVLGGLVFASKKTVYELSLVLLELTEKFVESEAANEQYRNSAEERLANLREWAEYQW